MFRALMRIMRADISNEFLSKDPSKFLDYFDTVRCPLLRREKDGSPDDVIKNIKSLQSLTGRFQLTSDLFYPELLAASLIKQDISITFMTDTWYPVFHELNDSPEGYYYMIGIRGESRTREKIVGEKHKFCGYFKGPNDEGLSFASPWVFSTNMDPMVALTFLQIACIFRITETGLKDGGWAIMAR